MGRRQRSSETAAPTPTTRDNEGRSGWPERLALAAPLALLFVAGLRRIWATDFWWQHRAGEYVARVGWPRVDPFSYVLVDAPWIELRWLYCWFQYTAMETVGPASLVLLKCVAVVVAFALVTRAAGAASAPVIAIVLAVAVMASSQRLFVRPEVVSWLFFATFVFVLARYRARPDSRAVWLLPVVQVVWVNTHTMFFYGPATVGLLLGVATAAAVVAARGGPAWAGTILAASVLPAPALRRLAAVFAACCVACLVNPYGVRALAVPLTQFGQLETQSRVITELQSPFALGASLTSVVYYQVLIAIAALALLLNLRRPDPFWLLLAASQLYLSLLAVRNLPLFCLAVVPFAIDALSRAPLAERIPGAWRGRAHRLAVGAVALFCVASAWSIATDRYSARQNHTTRFGLGIAPHRYPVAALDLLDRHDVRGRVFASSTESAYVLARGRQVFADPRGDVYDEDTLRAFLRVQSDPAAWEAAVRRYDLQVAVLDPYVPLASGLIDHPQWHLVWFDEVCVVFARADRLGTLDPFDRPEDFDRAVAGLRERLPHPTAFADLTPWQSATPAQPYLQVADVLIWTRAVKHAGSWLDDAEAAAPWLTGIAHRRITVAQVRGDHAGVIRAARAALEETPDDPRVVFALGQSAFALGQDEEAREWLIRAARLAPSRARTWALLGELALRRDDAKAAVDAWSRAVELEPENATYVRELARARDAAGR